jgi:DNA-binding NtrC family response regulator
VLVVDDDSLLRKILVDALGTRGFRVLTAATLLSAAETFAASDVDVVLLDEVLPDGRGHTLCARLAEGSPTTKIIFMTAFPEFEHALRAVRAGAYDYLVKPFELEALLLAVDRSVNVLDLESIKRRELFRRNRDTSEIALVGDSAPFAEVRRLVELSAPSDAPVLVTGETGTGKGLVAKAIHALGTRHAAGGAFVALSCAALPDNLVEAELFGWERGAFTGAVAAHEGAFGMADGGTLFLDEIGEMPLHLQPKLLAALEDRVVRRIGGRLPKPIDARVVAATNVALAHLVEEKLFRADLFYRLNVIHIHIPPLRERPEDIPALARHLLSGICKRREPAEIDDAELARLGSYPWPGNVRELRNVLERAVLLQGGRLRPWELIQDSPLPSQFPARPASADLADPSKPLLLAEVERLHIGKALRGTGGNLTLAARVLGISLSTLKRRVKQTGSF